MGPAGPTLRGHLRGEGDLILLGRWYLSALPNVSQIMIVNKSPMVLASVPAPHDPTDAPHNAP